MDVGIAGSSLASTGHRTVFAACSEVVMRIVPAGLTRSSLSEASPTAMVSSAGPSAFSSCSPACVGATRRVVRVSRRTPSRVSSRRTVWLSADWEVPSLAAARVKLCSSATVAKAFRSASSSRCIHEL